MNKILFNTETQTIAPYPRKDDAPVVGLDPKFIILDLVVEPYPNYNPSSEALKSIEDIDLQSNVLTRSWEVVPLMPRSKRWNTVQEFMSHFTLQEKAAISMSADPTIAALRLELTTWQSYVSIEDERVIAGLEKLVELGIISSQRKNEIVATAS